MEEFISRVLIAFLILTPNLTHGGVYYNPILDTNTPDPFIWLHTDGFYYMAQTTRAGGIIAYKSEKLTDFRTAANRHVYQAPEGLMNLWAPEIHFLQGNWYIYFALDDGDNANHRMYVIKALNSTDPLGEYTEETRLATPTEDYWAIDGTVMEYTTTDEPQLYFIWSGWPTIDAGFPQNIYIAPMLDPMTISGSRVLLREPSQPWEMIGEPLLEGPEVLRQDPGSNRTIIVFSASGSWTADYCLGIMGIDNNLDPMVASNWWNDESGCVFWRNDEENVYGTGHASFVQKSDGSDWIIYHAMEAPDGGWANRTARVEKFAWSTDGFPEFPRPQGLDRPLVEE